MRPPITLFAILVPLIPTLTAHAAEPDFRTISTTGEATVYVTPDIPTQVVSLPTNDIIYDKVTQKIYASVPSSAGPTRGNTVTVIDPQTGAIGTSIPVGSEPATLALSDDGKYLYVALNGAAAIRRIDMTTLTPDLQFALGSDSFSGAFHAGETRSGRGPSSSASSTSVAALTHARPATSPGPARTTSAGSASATIASSSAAGSRDDTG